MIIFELFLFFENFYYKRYKKYFKNLNGLLIFYNYYYKLSIFLNCLEVER